MNRTMSPPFTFPTGREKGQVEANDMKCVDVAALGVNEVLIAFHTFHYAISYVSQLTDGYLLGTP